jgi:hypothetical protein
MDDVRTTCIDCGQPFKLGVNVFTADGAKETGISGTCERCFDALFDDEDEDDEPECARCHGDTRDPQNDYMLPCPMCQGEQHG